MILVIFVKKYMTLRTSLFLLSIIVVLVINGCANPGTPTGGPKDETPPVVRKSEPELNALNFKGEKIVISFDELIQVKEISQKLVVSPPMNKLPSVVARGDELYIQFEDTLQDNTTYTLDFADAVTDNNEGNVIPGFTFSFSTGEFIDSLEVSGHLWNAENLKPVSGAMISLYSNFADSAFQTLVPMRLAKTDSDGAFTIKNVRPGKYCIYALEDANKNYKFDQKGENIAWSDSVIVPSFEYKQFEDSVGEDSVAIVERLVYTPDSLELFLFAPDFYDQYLKTDERKELGRLNLVFNEPIDSFQIDPVDEVYQNDWKIFEWSGNRDSVYVWITDSTIFNRDSLTFCVQYAALDSLEQVIVKQDTLTFYYFDETPKEKRPKRKKDKDEEKDMSPPVPAMQINKLPQKIDLFSLLPFELKTMPVKFDPNGITLHKLVDTLLSKVDFDLVQDSMNYRKFTINRKWEPGSVYELRVDSASFMDIYGHVNNPIASRFTVLETNDYSTLYINVEDPKSNYLVQILNKSGNAVRQSSVPESGKIKISFLKPGRYMLRMVVDVNGNNQWDSGDFEAKSQPEEIFYYMEELNLRADWDHEITWDKESFDKFEFVEKFQKESNNSSRGRNQRDGRSNR